MARPVKYDPHTEALKIIHRYSQGEHIEHICKDPDVPSHNTFYGWLHEYPELNEAYARAGESHSHHLINQALEIVDDQPPSDDRGRTDSGYVRWLDVRARLRLSIAEKKNRRAYGQHQHVEHSGNIQSDPTDVPERPSREAWLTNPKSDEGGE